MLRPHTDDDQLDCYAMGALPAETAAGVEEHLLECAGCRERLRQSDEFASLFRQTAALPEARPRRLRAGSWGWRVAGGAAAAAAMVAVLFVGTRRDGGSPAAPAIVTLEALRGPETSAEIPAGRPAILLFDIATPARGSYEARIFDRNGDEVLKPRADVRDGRLSVAVESLAKGSYWVRVYRTGNGDPVTEYGLRAR
jgi:hypothetical protein